MTEQYIHFVRHQDVADFYELGWTISSFFDGVENHGSYSVIMQWPGRGEPRTPLQNKPDRADPNERFQIQDSDFQPGKVRAGADIPVT
jgi:hypothetical protein